MVGPVGLQLIKVASQTACVTELAGPATSWSLRDEWEEQAAYDASVGRAAVEADVL